MATVKPAELTPLQAAEYYARALQENTGDAQAHLNLGSAYYITGQFDAAIKEFQNALALSPDLAHAHYYLGVLYGKRGDKTQALAELNQVLKSSVNSLLKAQAKIQLDLMGR